MLFFSVIKIILLFFVLCSLKIFFYVITSFSIFISALLLSFLYYMYLTCEVTTSLLAKIIFIVLTLRGVFFRNFSVPAALSPVVHSFAVVL